MNLIYLAVGVCIGAWLLLMLLAALTLSGRISQAERERGMDV